MNLFNQEPFSNRFLLGLFIIALPLFIALRWDYSGFIDGKVQQLAVNQGIKLGYDEFSFSGTSISFRNLNIQKAGVPPLSFQSLNISPAWLELLTGNIAASIATEWQANPIAADLSQQGERLQLKNIEATIDLATTTTLQQELIAKVSGTVSAQGSLQYNLQTSQPVSSNLSLSWSDAKAGLATPEFDLGNITATLTSQDDATKPWQWEVSGKPAIIIQASGTLMPRGANPKVWPITGSASVEMGDTNPTLAMMFQSFAGGKQAKINISGILSQPRTDIIR